MIRSLTRTGSCRFPTCSTAPGVWAELVLMGDARWVPFLGGVRREIFGLPSRLLLWLLAALFLLLGPFLWWRDYRRVVATR